MGSKLTQNQNSQSAPLSSHTDSAKAANHEIKAKLVRHKHIRVRGKQVYLDVEIDPNEVEDIKQKLGSLGAVCI